MYTCVLHGVKECVLRVLLRESDYLLYVLHFPYVIPLIFDYYVLKYVICVFGLFSKFYFPPYIVFCIFISFRIVLQ